MHEALIAPPVHPPDAKGTIRSRMQRMGPIAAELTARLTEATTRSTGWQAQALTRWRGLEPICIRLVSRSERRNTCMHLHAALIQLIRDLCC
jgi:hypothetical protein